MHGYAFTEAILRQTEKALLVDEGALYPALHRMEAKGWIEAEWGLSDNDRRAKYYRLTPDGRRRLRTATGRTRLGKLLNNFDLFPLTGKSVFQFVQQGESGFRRPSRRQGAEADLHIMLRQSNRGEFLQEFVDAHAASLGQILQPCVFSLWNSQRHNAHRMASTFINASGRITWISGNRSSPPVRSEMLFVTI